MKRTAIIVAALLTGLTFTIDAAVVSNMTRLLINKTKNAMLAKSRSDDTAPAPYMPMMMQVSGDNVVHALEALGVIIYNRRDDLLLTSVPTEVVDIVIALDGVLEASMSGDMSSCLDISRTYGNVDAVHSGNSLSSPYTGKGVVMGLTDIGFDAQHIAFKDAISAIYDYDTTEARRTAVTTAGEVAEWTTDHTDEYHATHVANIMCGRYMGNSYYGVAPGAELVATTSDLSDVGLLAGIEDIISYAKSVGKPAVVNMSMSNYLGPHDGSDLLCRYLTKTADDATICISAGNSGGSNNFATHLFTPEHPMASVIVNTYRGWNGFEVEGLTDIWGLGDDTLEYRIEIFDIDNKSILWKSPWTTDSLKVSDTNMPEIAQYITGEIEGLGGISTLNGRYNIALHYDIKSPLQSSKGSWSKYYITISVRGPEATRINIFTDGVYSFIGKGIDTGTTFTTDGSINDMCTAEGIVACGACSSRNTAPNINGEPLSWRFDTESVAKFSSYSFTPGIKNLPHLCAPGNYVVSALSSHYYAEDPDVQPSAQATVNGTDYYWWACCGTSMSAPYIAGVFALWLEADPHLTTPQLLDIATKTARRDFSDISDPRWGAGCIDAEAGLKQIAISSGIENVNTTDVEPLEIRVNPDRSLTIYSSTAARVYNTEGKVVDHTSQLPCGLYIVTVPSHTPRKIIVR